MVAFSRRAQIRKANKEIYAKLAARSPKLDKKSPSQFLGMTHREFQAWCDTEVPPERFIK